MERRRDLGFGVIVTNQVIQIDVNRRHVLLKEEWLQRPVRLINCDRKSLNQLLLLMAL